MIVTGAVEVEVAAIAAARAVLGAIVGGVGGYLAERKFRDRRADAVARAGARVVDADVQQIDAVLEIVEKDGEIWPFQKLGTT